MACVRGIWVLLLFLSLVDCTRGWDQSALRVQLANEPVSLDPTFAEDGVSLQILYNTSEGLVGYDDHGVLKKRLAESYAISSQGKRYEFILKKEARWSDGRPVEVKDFITSFRRALEPTSISKLAPLLYAIRGAKLFHSGKIPAHELGVKEESGKLVIELEYPAPYFIQALTLSTAFPVRQDILEANRGSWPELAPSTGPYRLVSHQLDRKLELEANPYYYGLKPPISKVDLIVIGDESTGLNLFENGRLDILTRVPSLDLERLKKNYTIHSSPTTVTYFLAFNCRKPPFDDARWRRAFAGAIRRDEIAAALNAELKPAWSWIPHGLEGFIPYEDPQTRFAAETVWLMKNTNSFKKPIEAGFDTGVRNSKIMEKVQYDIEKAFGIKLSLNHLDWKTYVKTLQTDPPALFRFGWMAPFMDPLTHLKIFTRADVNNYTGCFDVQYDRLISEIERMKPGAQRRVKMSRRRKFYLSKRRWLFRSIIMCRIQVYRNG